MIFSRSPSLARRAGPGTRPLKVQAGKKMPGAISISLSMAATSKVRRVRPSGRARSFRYPSPSAWPSDRTRSRRDRRARPSSCCHAPCRTSVRRKDRPTSPTCRVQPSGQVRSATVPCRRQWLRHRRRPSPQRARRAVTDQAWWFRRQAWMGLPGPGTKVLARNVRQG